MRQWRKAATLAALGWSGAAIAAPSAQFDFVTYRALDAAPLTPQGSFRNPVIPGFQPDPSIVKVGNEFYLVTSTFSWFPGLPIYRSTDLMNWRLVGHAIDRPGQVDFSGLGTNRGLFAPAIAHHGGKFWIVNTCIDCKGNFVITADKPEGPWSDPVWLDFGGIDPSLVWDDDGKSWIVYNDAPPGEPLYDGHRAIWIQQFDSATMKILPERKLLVNGGLDLAAKPVWAEGPHIYRHDGWYYLMAAEGGTADQHSETIYRSRHIDGPYEKGPVNPILTQRNMDSARPDRVEATGHADMVRLDHFVTLGIEGDAVVLRCRAGASEAERGVELARVNRIGRGDTELRLELNGGTGHAWTRAAGQATWTAVSPGFSVEPLASVHAGLFTGLVVGPYVLDAP